MGTSSVNEKIITMKEVEVEIISKEDIKPSSPTPSHLGIFKFCLLDHLIPAPYSPIIFFYPSSLSSLTLSGENPNSLHLLKQSLSDTLTLFYPLAGKIKDDLSILCNDEGANFIEAKVQCSLSEFLTHPDLISLHKLLPCDLKVPKESYVGTYACNIQVNVFDCGGISIGLCISHRILDGASLSSFLETWTSKATDNNKEVVKPEILMASSLFPMNSDDEEDDGLWLRDSSMAMWGSMFKKGKFVTRRFWFSNSAIAKLKLQMVNSSSSDMVKNPTRLEIVSAILWKSFMDASKAQAGGCNNSSQLKRPCLVSHLVNLRRRIKDKNDNDLCRSAENAIGNLLWLAFAKSNISMADNNNNHETRLDGLVKKLRKALSTINDKFIDNMRTTNNFTRKSTMLKSLNIKSIMKGDQEAEEVDSLGFTSWCNLGFYEVDFGWGKPIWVSSIGSCASVFMNLVVLVDSRFGDGIEAWITLDEPFMAHLETNPELLGFAMLDPNPLVSPGLGSQSLCKI